MNELRLKIEEGSDGWWATVNNESKKQKLGPYHDEKELVLSIMEKVALGEFGGDPQETTAIRIDSTDIEMDTIYIDPSHHHSQPHERKVVTEKFKAEQRDDGWYAVFPDGEEHGPFPDQPSMMTDPSMIGVIMKRVMLRDDLNEIRIPEKYRSKMRQQYNCPRCGKLFVGVNGFWDDIEGVPVIFCSHECSKKRRMFKRNFQKDMI